MLKRMDEHALLSGTLRDELLSNHYVNNGCRVVPLTPPPPTTRGATKLFREGGAGIIVVRRMR